jgi:hypothetical protein
MVTGPEKATVVLIQAPGGRVRFQARNNGETRLPTKQIGHDHRVHG